MEEHKLLELTDDQLERFASKTSDYLYKKMKSDKRKNKDNALHNTKKIMESYNLLKERCNETYEDLERTPNEDLWNHGRLSISSLMVNRAKTVKMMKYVDEALDSYKIICDNSNHSSKSRRHSILTKLYVEEKQIDFVAGFFDKDRTTIIRNKDEAIQDLSILLFGIDMLNL